jgi:ABC-type branched-subunit amino acid transport system ATPase component/ABC-type branched-subunit amino acid transport system permease subunit
MTGALWAALELPFTSFELRPEVIVLGIISGLTFGLLGVGLTLVYRTSRVINFAHGDVGVLATSVFLVLTLTHGWPYLPALAVTLAVAVVIGAVLEFVVVRRFEAAPRLVVLVATLAASQVLLGLGFFLPRKGFGAHTFPTPFTASIEIGLIRLQAGELMILVLAPAIVVALAALLRRSTLGLGARAAAENLEAARLAGAPARRISRWMWVIAALLSAASAILTGPLQGLTTTQTLGPSLMVRALAAAVIGGFSSSPHVMAGGIVVGVVERLVSWNYPEGRFLEILLLAMIVLTILVRRDLGQRVRGGEASSWSLGGKIRALEPRVARLPATRRLRAGALAAALLAAIAAPLGRSSGQQVLLSSMVLFAVMGLSTVVLTGFGGQVSLAQYTFVGVGAVVGGRMFQLGYPPWIGMLYAAVAGAVVAVIVGLPALRIRGLFLAVTTLSFSVAAASWLPSQRWLVPRGGGFSSTSMPREEWFGIDFADERAYYWLCLALLIATCALVARLRSTGTGRRLLAVRDNEAAAAALSVPPRRTKLTGFVLAGMMAALAGYFYGGLLVNFNAGTVLEPSVSLSLVLMTVLGGVTTISGAILGGLWVQGIPYLFGARWGIVSTGVGVLLVLQVARGGLAEPLFRLRDLVLSRVLGEAIGGVRHSDRALGAVRPKLVPAPRRDEVPELGPVPILAEDITVRFGGLTAVKSVSLEAHHGEIVGLVGPNGAGKTTMFDVLAGQIRPAMGSVVIEGRDVTAFSPDQRALLGLGRTFQDARLFPELPLIDAFKVALEKVAASEVLPSLLGLPSSTEAEHTKDVRAEELIDLLGLGPFATLTCGELSTGTRRFVDLGLLLATGSRILLLDEPTAGIAQREVEQFTPVLREVRDHLDATIVVIDHDIPMLVGLVDRLYVMSAGELIADGDPRVVREDPAVVAAYLGTDERVISRSGAAATAPVERRPRRREPLHAGSQR